MSSKIISLTFGPLASCLPAQSGHASSPAPPHHSSVSVTRLHVLGLSQILAFCSSSCTNSAPSPRKGDKFSECLVFGCLEIFFLCHLLVITALNTCIPAPQNLGTESASTLPPAPKAYSLRGYREIQKKIQFAFISAEQTGLLLLSFLSELAILGAAAVLATVVKFSLILVCLCK